MNYHQAYPGRARAVCLKLLNQIGRMKIPSPTIVSSLVRSSKLAHDPSETLSVRPRLWSATADVAPRLHDQEFPLHSFSIGAHSLPDLRKMGDGTFGMPRGLVSMTSPPMLNGLF